MFFLYSFLQGMRAGLPKYVPVNLKDIEAAGFQAGEEVSLESLKDKGLINPSGRERKLPLKVNMILTWIVSLTCVMVVKKNCIFSALEPQTG